MANIMSMVKLRNKPSRNGFDLSFKRNFTAKCGELLPVMCKEVIPGDKFTIDLSSFTRTMPVNTAAFARIREYYDFFYVPFNILWNRSNAVLSQMDYNQHHALQLGQGLSTVFNGELPYLTTNQIWNYVKSMGASSVSPTIGNNIFGFSRAYGSAKLLEYLNLGNYFDAIANEEGTQGSSQPRYNLDVLVYPLLAYQRIYSDFYRDQQWERPDPSTFNLDYMSGTTSMNINLPQFSNTDAFYQYQNFFDLRYCNWSKDMYHGLLPSAQYGETAVVPLDGDVSGMGVSNGQVPYSRTTAPDGAAVQGTDGTARYVPATLTDSWGYSSRFLIQSSDISVNANLSILALRQYEFLQKWKEIVQSADQDYQSQIEAIWGVKVSKHVDECVTYLGGISSSLDINEVVNTNITGENSAEIAGKGIGVSNGKITFNSDGQFGYIMCIYHCMPIVDYTLDYIDPQYLRINAEDFANPVFDKVGMQQVTSASIFNGQTPGGDIVINQTPFVLGYAPRYIDYKTSIDTSVGAFKRSMSHWVVSYGVGDLEGDLGTSNSNLPQPDVSAKVDYTFFKVSPALLDPIFVDAANDSLDSDQFLCSTFFDIKAVRNLDVNGLPY